MAKKKKKKREPMNMTKVQSHGMLVLPNVRIKLSNERKKNQGTNKCDKSIAGYDVGIA